MPATSQDKFARNRPDLQRARLAQVRREMRARDVPALLEIDPSHIVYATGASNMQIFTQRTPSRYLLILADGPVTLFEFVGCEHLAGDLPTIDHVAISEGLDLVSSGGDVEAATARFAAAIRERLREHDPAIDRLAVGRFPFQAIDALRTAGFALSDANEVMVPARAVKLPEELPYIREAMARVEAGVRRLEQRSEPGRTESETWAEFHYELMAKEGQYVSTRLFQSGERTYPYFREAGGRLLQKGDLLCLDTDAVGFENYAVDFSRTFLCGDGRATDNQKLLYARAREQLEANAELLGAGVAFRELAEKAWRVPEEHMGSRYYCIGHGLGMAGEFPNIPHHRAGQAYPLDGHLLPGMIICLESYVGWSKSREGVKLEDQFLIHPTHVERMSTYSFDDRLQSRMV